MVKSPNREDIAQVVEALCHGDDTAFHTLIEESPAVIPLLVEWFQQEQNGASRARIVEVIWQHRQPASISFLSTALEDSHPEVWKQALDGLVTIGGPESRSALVNFVNGHSHDERVSWVEEALEQLRD